MNCLIWDTPAEPRPWSGDGQELSSPRTGGAYRIAETAIPGIAALTPVQKAKLTTWLVDQRRSGTEVPMISSLVLEEIRARRPLTVGERKERFFRAIISAELGIDAAIFLGAAAPDKRLWHNLLSAWTEATTYRQTERLAELLVEDGLLLTNHPGIFSVGSAGWQYIDELGAAGGETNQAFVAMWFAEQMDEAWHHGISPGLRDAGYLPLRIDNKQHNGKIDDEIVAEIKRSKFLVADFTCGTIDGPDGLEAISRGGVYYEAGLAHGLGKEVIFCCRQDRMGAVHFDTRQFAHLVWTSPEELRSLLYNRVVATIGEAPNAPGRGKS